MNVLGFVDHTAPDTPTPLSPVAQKQLWTLCKWVGVAAFQENLVYKNQAECCISPRALL